MRIQNGMHGPIVILPDDPHERIALDEVILTVRYYPADDNGPAYVDVKVSSTKHHEYAYGSIDLGGK